MGQDNEGNVRVEATVRRVFVFKTCETNSRGFNKIVAIPEDKVETIESYYGSHNVYLKVNGIETDSSFERFVELMGKRVDIA